MDWGRDTLLTGSRMEGRQVQVETGGNLRLESLQDRETDDSRNTGGGISVSAGGGHVSGSGSAQKQTLRSDYESVTEQAGIYAGDQGFQIQAGGNTHLKGSVIHSDAPAEKNRLETGTLSWENVKNKASYKANGQGVAFSATTRTGQEDRRKLNERGLYPEVVSTVKGRAESTTKAGISAGSVIIREGEKQIQPVKQLNRDTTNSLQKLATIFDKEKVQEKQELVNELSKVGNRAIHELAARKGWQEGSNEKILAHSIFGGLLSSLAGGKIATGTLAGGVGEYVNGRILAAKGKAWVEKHPDLVQAISAAVGSAVGAVTGESSIGSNVSLGGTKWNELKEVQITDSLRESQNIMDEKIDAETQESKNEVNPLFQDNESLSTLLFLNAKIIESAGADVAILSDDSEIAGELLLHGIWGHGEAVTVESELGQKMGKDLSQNAILREGIRQYGENLEVNQSVNIFASIDLQHSDENNNLPSLNGRLGYGRVKMGILITRDSEGISFYGRVGDSYNYDWHNIADRVKELKNDFSLNTFVSTIIDGVNNAAVATQEVGALIPFSWTAKVDGYIPLE